MFFCSPADALPTLPKVGLYIGGNYGPFIAGSKSNKEFDNSIGKTEHKHIFVDGESLINRSLENLGAKVGISLFGISLEGEAIYGYKKNTSESGSTILAFFDGLSHSSEGYAYLLGMISANLELSGLTLLSPYIGLGVGAGSVRTLNPSGNSSERYAFSLVGQLRTGLTLDLGSFLIPIKPYVGYRLLLFSHRCSEKISDTYKVVTDNIDQDVGVIDKVKQSITVLRDTGHMSHNAEIGFRIHIN